MKNTKLPDKLEVAPGYTVGCWKKLNLNPENWPSQDWKKALEIFDARIRHRFLEPVDALIECEANCSPKRFGFAILAIDFLVIETLQGFREGMTNHKGKSKQLFTNFLTGWNVFQECLPTNGDPEPYAELVYSGYRCDLHHSGATQGAFRVRVGGPVFHFKSEEEVEINRTELHKALVHKFDEYLRELRQPDQSDLRCNFLKKMDAICGVPGNAPE